MGKMVPQIVLEHWYYLRGIIGTWALVLVFESMYFATYVDIKRVQSRHDGSKVNFGERLYVRCLLLCLLGKWSYTVVETLIGCSTLSSLLNMFMDLMIHCCFHCSCWFWVFKVLCFVGCLLKAAFWGNQPKQNGQASCFVPTFLYPTSLQEICIFWMPCWLDT